MNLSFKPLFLKTLSMFSSFGYMLIDLSLTTSSSLFNSGYYQYVMPLILKIIQNPNLFFKNFFAILFWFSFYFIYYLCVCVFEVGAIIINQSYSKLPIAAKKCYFISIRFCNLIKQFYEKFKVSKKYIQHINKNISLEKINANHKIGNFY